MTSDSLSQAFRRILPVSSHSPYCRVVAHSSLRPSITAYEISTGKILNHKLCLRQVISFPWLSLRMTVQTLQFPKLSQHIGLLSHPSVRLCRSFIRLEVRPVVLHLSSHYDRLRRTDCKEVRRRPGVMRGEGAVRSVSVRFLRVTTSSPRSSASPAPAASVRRE